MRSCSPAFYLVARSFTETSAGIRSMHILCDQLNSFGFEAFLVGVDKPFLTNDSLKTQLLTRRIRDQHFKSKRRIISIYDESIQGNPLNSDFYVRWLLNRDGFLAAGNRKKNAKNSLTFVYAQEIDPVKPRLFVNTLNYDFFKNYKKTMPRDLTLFYAGKLKSLGISVLKPVGAIEIFRSGPKKQTREELRDLFSQARTLYLAEDSALALEAAICGCPTVHMTEYFKFGPLSQEVGGIGLALSDDATELKSVNLDDEFIERYMATLALRTFHDVLNFCLQAQELALTSDTMRKPRYKILVRHKLLLRANKVHAGYKNSGMKGIFAVFFSHIEFMKKGS